MVNTELETDLSEDILRRFEQVSLQTCAGALGYLTRQARAVKVANKLRKEAAERKEPAAKKKPASSVTAEKSVDRVDPADSPALRSADRLLKILEATEKSAARLQKDGLSETENSTETAGETGQVNSDS